MYAFEEYTGAFSITPNDTNDLARRVRAISVNTVGIVRMKLADGDVVDVQMEPGVIYHGVAVVRVYNTGTGAGGINGWY